MVGDCLAEVRLGLEGKLALGKVSKSLTLAESGSSGLLGRQTSSHSAGLTGAEVEGLVLLVLQGSLNLRTTSLVVDSQHLSDLLANLAAGSGNGRSARAPSRNEPKRKEEIKTATMSLAWRTYILPSLEAAPPVTLATRSWESSFLSSPSLTRRSAFGFSRRVLRFNFSAGKGDESQVRPQPSQRTKVQQLIERKDSTRTVG